MGGEKDKTTEREKERKREREREREREKVGGTDRQSATGAGERVGHWDRG